METTSLLVGGAIGFVLGAGGLYFYSVMVKRAQLRAAANS